jgi:predicted ATPase
MRSSFTTVALCVPRGWQSTSGTLFSPFLASELQRLQKEAIYPNRVFFIRNLGFITPTEARRISFEKTVGLRKFTKRRTGISASSWSRSGQEVWWSGSA